MSFAYWVSQLIKFAKWSGLFQGIASGWKLFAFQEAMDAYDIQMSARYNLHSGVSNSTPIILLRNPGVFPRSS